MHSRPSQRTFFTIAVICALPVEYDAVCLLADEVWDREGSYYQKSKGDSNFYVTCRFGKHNAVVVLLPSPGKSSCAGAIARLKMSFRGIDTVFLVGICGGTPKSKGPAGTDIFLGDVIISDDVMPYDYGKQYVSGFKNKLSLGYRSGNFYQTIRGLLTLLSTTQKQAILESQATNNLKRLQEAADQDDSKPDFRYPGRAEDHLFEANYLHKHHENKLFVCLTCETSPEAVCDEAIDTPCSLLGCNLDYVTSRAPSIISMQQYSSDIDTIRVHFGPFVSGDTVLKSAKHREELCNRYSAIGFEMEAAGLINEAPYIIIKGVCDYADSHKDKKWQPYAAAGAAAVFKSILEHFPQKKTTPTSLEQVALKRRINQYDDPVHLLPFSKNPYFQGRNEAIQTLQEMLISHSGHQRVALHGLGGIGKSQVALELAHWAKNVLQDDEDGDCSVIWIPALSVAAFEKACSDAVKRIRKLKYNTGDPKVLFKEHFSLESTGRWLLILDNADDYDLIFGNDEDSNPEKGLMALLPQSDLGSILVTTRDRKVAVMSAKTNVISLTEMNKEEATAIFNSSILNQDTLKDTAALSNLLETLGYIPLAITQAISYINTNQISLDKYVRLLQAAPNDKLLKILQSVPNQSAQYFTTQSSILFTWLLSFNKITAVHEKAGGLLVFIACIEPKAIPHSLLPVGSSEEEHISAIGTLLNYSFLTRRDEDLYDMHALVHAAVRTWTSLNLDKARRSTLEHLRLVSPGFEHKYIKTRQLYFPHVMKAVNDFETDELEFTLELKAWLGNSAILDGRSALGVTILEPLVTDYESLAADSHEGRLLAQWYLAIAYTNSGKTEEAIQILEHVIRIRKQPGVQPSPNRQEEMSLAVAFLENGKYKESIALSESIVETLAKTLMQDSLELLEAKQKLATAYSSDSQHEKALPILEEVVALSEKLLPEDNPARTEAQMELAAIYNVKGQWGQAAVLVEHCIAVYKNVLDDNNHEKVFAQYALGALYYNMGRLKEAIFLLEEICERYEHVPPADQKYLLMAQYSLGKGYLADGQIEKSIRLQEHVVVKWKDLRQEGFRGRIQSQISLAKAYNANGQAEKALHMLEEETIPASVENLAEEHLDRLGAHIVLAVAFMGVNENRKAVPILEYVLSVCERIVGENDYTRVLTQYYLAQAYLTCGQTSSAVKLLQNVVKQREDLPVTHHERLRSEYTLAMAYRSNGQREKSFSLLQYVVDQHKALAEDHPDRIESENALYNFS